MKENNFNPRMWGDPNQDAFDLDLDKNWKVLEKNLSALLKKERKRWFLIFFLGLLGISALGILFYFNSDSNLLSPTKQNVSILTNQEFAQENTSELYSKKENQTKNIEKSISTIYNEDSNQTTPAPIFNDKAETKPNQYSKTSTNSTKTTSSILNLNTSNKSLINQRPKSGKLYSLKINSTNKSVESNKSSISIPTDPQTKEITTASESRFLLEIDKSNKYNRENIHQNSVNNFGIQTENPIAILSNQTINAKENEKSAYQLDLNVFTVQEKISNLRCPIRYEDQATINKLPEIIEVIKTHKESLPYWISVKAAMGLNTYSVYSFTNEMLKQMEFRQSVEKGTDSYILGVNLGKYLPKNYYIKSGINVQYIYHKTKYSYITNEDRVSFKYRLFLNEDGSQNKTENYFENEASEVLHRDRFFNRYKNISIPLYVGKEFIVDKYLNIRFDVGFHCSISQTIKGFLPNVLQTPNVYFNINDYKVKRAGTIQGSSHLEFVTNFSKRYFGSVAAFGIFDLNSRFKHSNLFQEKNNILGAEFNLGYRF